MLADKKQILPKAIALLDCYSRDRKELGVREAARLLDISSSAAGRLMQQLRDLGVLKQNGESHGYSLSARVLTWASVYADNLDLRNLAHPIMAELQRITDETISLYIMEGIERVCVDQIESTQTVRIVSRIGLRLPLHAGSPGKVLLAYLPESQLLGILDSLSYAPLTEKTIINKPQLMAELRKIRENGYAISHGEWLPDASGVAAPIFDFDNKVVAALTISGPSQRFNGDKLNFYIHQVMHSASTISTSLGFINNQSMRGEQ